jgi:hypothetical protein
MRILRSAVVLLLLGTLWASAAAARPEKPASRRDASQGSAELRVRNFLISLLKAASCTIDPPGSVSSGKAGCGMDPLGGTQNQNTEAGCRLDPLGQCVPDH